jgi:hypothetical protein
MPFGPGSRHGLVRPGGDGEEPIGRVVVAVQQPARLVQEPAQGALGEQIVVPNLAPMAGGERDPQRRGTVDRGDSIGERGDDLGASGGTVEFGCA